MSNSRFIIVFATTRSFLQARDQMKRSGIPHEVRSTPRHLSDQCGMCLSFDSLLRSEVEHLFSPDSSELLYLDE